MSGANHPTPETKSPICPHGNDTRIVWCVWCNDPARMTAAAQPGPPPVMMTVGGSSERSIPATSNTETCPRCGGPYGTGSYHEELVCQEIQIDRLTRELGEARKAHDKDFMDGHKHVYRLQVERDRLRAALEEFIRLRKVAVESAVVPSTWWSDSERAYAEAQCLLSGEPSAHETKAHHTVKCKKFPDPFDERDPVGPCTCGAESAENGLGDP